jgi:N6-L-threonylcarbamoyladenine synthase
MRILAIETSCDETAVALLACEGTAEAPAITIIKQALYSQTKEHAPYGGVFPALAKREHAKNIVPLFLEAIEPLEVKPLKLRGLTSKTGTLSEEQDRLLRNFLKQEGSLAETFFEHIVPLPRPEIDAIAVTQGPGLEPALWVGLNFAKAISYLWDIPLVPINHMEGHMLSVIVNENISTPIDYPALALLVSGGHTELVHVTAPLSYEKIGQTRDDAVGEAFDKVARLLSLPYPGGPEIGKLGAESRALGETIPDNLVFPRPMIHMDTFDFSYAGLKTSVLYKVRELGDLNDTTKRLIARSFEEAAIDVLIAKTKKALENFAVQTFIVGGGVAASAYLRVRLNELMADFPDVILRISSRDLSTDNAVMIGIAGYLRFISDTKKYPPYHGEDIKAHGTLRLA